MQITRRPRPPPRPSRFNRNLRFARRSVDDRREENIPEVGRLREEFDGDKRAFRAELRRPHDVNFHGLLRLGIFEHELGALGQRLRHDDHGAVGADGVRNSVNRLTLAVCTPKMQLYGNAQQNSLRAAALFGGQGTRQAGPDGAGVCRLMGRRRFQSSNPQKSISGATNSIPYSQPSGRGLPFHTTTAALLDPVARLVSATR